MQLTFRWYGKDDPVTLQNIRQIPNVTGIVTAIYDVPLGEIWPLDKIMELKKDIEKHNLKFEVIESVPVHEDIKLGLETRDKYIENYKKTLINLSKAGIKTVCYNFMPVFDWTRTDVHYKMEDGSKTLIYKQKQIEDFNPMEEELSLPGWATSYSTQEMRSLLQQYRDLSEEGLWENLSYFLKEIIPCAEEVGIRMAIHPDDPPWSIFDLPRIVKNKQDLKKLVEIVDSPSNGLTICTGSLGVDPNNDLVDIIRYFGKRDRINFVHFRNVKVFENGDFMETAHLSQCGSLDMFEILKACVEVGFDGPIRPDHGRMIWDEIGKPGYGLFDRALGASYITGLLEALNKIS